jgi:hypothetical protein
MGEMFIFQAGMEEPYITFAYIPLPRTIYLSPLVDSDLTKCSVSCAQGKSEIPLPLSWKSRIITISGGIEM